MLVSAEVVSRGRLMVQLSFRIVVIVDSEITGKGHGQQSRPSRP